ncbi:hypothetical protein ACFQ3Z_20485 [Streptomyces nogalater]
MGVPATLPGPALRRAVACRLRTRPAHGWIEEFRGHGVEAVLVHEELTATARDPRFAADLRPGACALLLPPWRFLS